MCQHHCFFHRHLHLSPGTGIWRQLRPAGQWRKFLNSYRTVSCFTASISAGSHKQSLATLLFWERACFRNTGDNCCHCGISSPVAGGKAGVGVLGGKIPYEAPRKISHEQGNIKNEDNVGYRFKRLFAIC